MNLLLRQPLIHRRTWIIRANPSESCGDANDIPWPPLQMPIGLANPSPTFCPAELSREGLIGAGDQLPTPDLIATICMQAR